MKLRGTATWVQPPVLKDKNKKKPHFLFRAPQYSLPLPPCPPQHKCGCRQGQVRGSTIDPRAYKNRFLILKLQLQCI